MPAPTPDPFRERLLHGGDAPLPDRVPLRAGPLSLVLEAGDLRHVHLGAREIVRRIYGAVRDEHWRTIPARVSRFELDTHADRFRCRYRAEHRAGDLAFAWTATIDGHRDGTLSFLFDGEALSTFRRNRIGLCLLHPTPGASGARVQVTTTDGAIRRLRFPHVVAVEQPIVGFHDLARLAWEVEPEVWLEAAFEGDVFETEDQRNWIDASYKTYSTPHALPIPVEVAAGTRVRQQITLRLVDGAGRSLQLGAAQPHAIDRDQAAVRFGDDESRRLPAIGLRLPPAPAGVPVSRSREALRGLSLSHLRVDLDAATAGDEATLAAARTLATSLANDGEQRACPIELALHLPPDHAEATRILSALDLESTAVARLLAFSVDRPTTEAATLEAVREWRARRLPLPLAPIASGTTGDLYRINLDRPPLADAVCWAMHPQAHAVDVTSIAETPAGAHDQVASVQVYFRGLPTVVSATLAAGGRPDPRQRSLFGAGWTLALLGALGSAGADSVTLGDTHGDAGYLDEAGLFPAYHVLAALGSLRRARLQPLASSLDTVVGLALSTGDTCTLLLANLAPRACAVALPPWDGAWYARTLDSATAGAASREATFFTRVGDVMVRDTRLPLAPFAVARVDGR